MNRTIARGITLVALALVANMVSAQSGNVPPTAKDALLNWLQAGSYRNWEKESAPHQSLGPHPVQVVVYLNPALDRSLAAKAAAHPVGAAAVKELFDASGKLAGWAVSVKTAADSEGGKGWYWYEILGTTPAARVVASANGVPLCVGCHAPGSDFVLIPYPLK